MNFKKRANGSWTNTPHYIHNTSTDTITTLPAIIHPTGTTATVGLKGNMEQSGTPTPDNPITPQGTGDKTENLFYKIISRTNIDSAGKIIINRDFDMVVAKVAEGETYSVSGVSAVMGFFVNEPEVGSQSYNNSRESVVSPVTIPQGVNYVAYRVNARPNVAMFNTGSRALPYKPYGVKIPISSGGTTTPVYLGEVETTRRIEKIDLGTLNWTKTASGNFWSDNFISDMKTIYNTDTGNAICTTFKEVTPNAVASTPYSFSSCLNGQQRPFVNKTGFENLTGEEFKQAMSGVYMYYVLANEETGIVNEPLMKIGDYADTVNNISIPVTVGGDTLSVSTTVQPSEVTVNYKGWHPVQNVHERDNGAWT